MLPISEDDRARIAAAVAKAEAASDGEIVTIVAPRSDSYNDVGPHYAVLLMLLVPVWFAVVPQAWIDWAVGAFLGWGAQLTRAEVMTYMFVKLAGAYLLVWLLFKWMKLRMALTPGGTKHRRVRRRAVELFHVTTEQRTKGRTGVLLYLSLLERRAEIVADEAIHSHTKPEVWGDAMTALVAELKAGRPGEAMVQAVEKIGAVLAECLPPQTENPNELPDRLIEL